MDCHFSTLSKVTKLFKVMKVMKILTTFNKQELSRYDLCVDFKLNFHNAPAFLG